MLALSAPLYSGPAAAQIGSERYSSIVIDAGTGRVLEAVNPDELRYPASLTKMMTAYMLFEALRDRRVSLDQLVPVSAHAASMSPSKLGLVPGMRLTVRQALLALVTKSANDAASALGELLGGSEERFAAMMTLRARALGMTATIFRNASGLPDPDQVTTAHDMAVLARRLVQDFPAEYRYFSTPEFVFHGRVIPNHDHLLTTYPGADGIKTGYTRAAGHNLVTSALRGGVRLIGVVLGAGSNARRDIHMAALLDQGFVAMDVPVVPRTTPVVVSIPRLVGSAHAATIRFVMQRSESRAHRAHAASRRGRHASRVARAGHHGSRHGHHKAARSRVRLKRVALQQGAKRHHRVARRHLKRVARQHRHHHPARHRRAVAYNGCAAHAKHCDSSERLANR